MQDFKKNYFQLFEISESFDVDIELVSEKYRELQAQSHPDRVAGASEEQKLRAVQFSSYINEAYAALKDPLKRAAYLLSIHGLDVGKVSQSDLGMDLLMEQMQLRERLEDLPKDDSALEELESLKKDVLGKLAQRLEKLAEDFSGQNFDSAKKLYHEMQFLYKLLSEIESGEESRLGY
ncbi:MAG: Fe-S protein assembly co-chaperone HscB [Gammaproteobacteria bacterium]|nr:Fe-S protein assembly co-chaperone HscB [Gammaproteobacteria bacterium]MBT3859076.1 Fe-S protein assembly co-chaperone HscB [Gammaproteobacteria bacterium]MBT3987076.1 Fe-S protein assembly co-chaperone HscB [Gammaproteobacteria bacterium]MBT4580659.1 Fe-S protein assembly co-chaperone HscB [Gammaproteobacteria bacterium]MBT4658594.1 Fe-S protein assembly co-chaperone HscB [Gammaproteobacteria bacterium]